MNANLREFVGKLQELMADYGGVIEFRHVTELSLSADGSVERLVVPLRFIHAGVLRDILKAEDEGRLQGEYHVRYGLGARLAADVGK